MSLRTKIVLALDGLPLDEAVYLTSVVGDRCYAVKIHSLFDKVGAIATTVTNSAFFVTSIKSFEN